MFLLPCASPHFIFTSMIVLICSYFSWVLITHIFISSLSHSLLSSYCALWLPLIEVIGLSFKNLCHNVCVEFSYILWLCCFDACSSGKFWCSPVFNLKFKRLLIETVPYKNISAHHKVTWITLPWLFVGQSSGCVCKGCWGQAASILNSCSTSCFTVSTDILLPAKMAFLYSPALSVSVNQTVSRRSSAASPVAPLPTSFATPKGCVFCTSGWARHLQRAHSLQVAWDVLPRALCSCHSSYSPFLVFSPARPLRYLHRVCSRFHASCTRHTM